MKNVRITFNVSGVAPVALSALDELLMSAGRGDRRPRARAEIVVKTDGETTLNEFLGVQDNVIAAFVQSGMTKVTIDGITIGRIDENDTGSVETGS